MNSTPRRRLLFRRERIDVSSEKVTNAIGELVKRRKSVAGKSRSAATLIGGLVFSATIAKQMRENPLFMDGIRQIVANSVVGATMGIAIARVKHQRTIHSATQNVGYALTEEAKTNTMLREFLGRYRFVIVDKKGRIAGTNFPRFIPGVGRLRLDSHKILARAQ